MKNWKRTICIILVCGLSLSAAACNAGNEVGGLGSLTMDDGNGSGGIGTLGEPEPSDAPDDELPPPEPEPVPQPVPEPTEPPQQEPAPTKGLSTEAYKCEEFNMTIPAGWKVNYKVIDSGNDIKRIYIFVCDPANPKNMIFFVEALEPFFSSEEGRSAWANVVPAYRNAPVLSEPNAEATLSQWSNIYALMKQEGILSGYFSDYSMKNVLKSEETSRSSEGEAISYVIAQVTIPGENEMYDMFYENKLQLMDAPTGLPAYATYYISYANNGVVLADSLAESQFDALHACLMTLDLTAYANKK